MNDNPVYQRAELPASSVDDYSVQEGTKRYLEGVRRIFRKFLGGRVPFKFPLGITRLLQKILGRQHPSGTIIDKKKVFRLIATIKDPNYAYSVEQLGLVTEDAIEVDEKLSHVRITFNPTVRYSVFALDIGLLLRAKLVRSLPSRYKVEIVVAPGTHEQDTAITKLLNDKESVAASLENPLLVRMIDHCLAPSYE